MSPEQAQGKKLDARSDIYSLATILYEVLTGKLPFDAKTPMEYIQLHVTKPPIPLDDRVPGKKFPAGLSDAIMRALHKRPEDRYGSATEFAEALRRWAPGVQMGEVFPRQLEATHVDPPAAAQRGPAGPAPSLDSSKTIRMGPGAPVASPLPAGMRAGYAAAPPAGAPGSVAKTKTGVSKGTIAAVAVGCLILGVVLTVGVIMMLQQ
jgi:serine/threonine-protein kinase